YEHNLHALAHRKGHCQEAKSSRTIRLSETPCLAARRRKSSSSPGGKEIVTHTFRSSGLFRGRALPSGPLGRPCLFLVVVTTGCAQPNLRAICASYSFSQSTASQSYFHVRGRRLRCGLSP